MATEIALCYKKTGLGKMSKVKILLVFCYLLWLAACLFEWLAGCKPAPLLG
jgi:hypothetical protein